MHSLAFKVNIMAKAVSNTGRLAMIMNNRKMGYTLLVIKCMPYPHNLKQAFFNLNVYCIIKMYFEVSCLEL